MRPGLTSRDLVCGVEALPDEAWLAKVSCSMKPEMW